MMRIYQSYSKRKVFLSFVFYGLLVSSTSFAQVSKNKTTNKPETNKNSINVKHDSSSIKEFISGTLYFSGIYFPNVVRIIIDTSKAELIKTCMAKCTVGSIIVYENVYFKNSKGLVSGPLNTTIQVQKPISKPDTLQRKQPSETILF